MCSSDLAPGGGGGAPAGPGPGIPPPFAPAAGEEAPGKPPKTTRPPPAPGKPGFFSRFTSALSSSSALNAAEYPDDPLPSRPSSPPPAPATAQEMTADQMAELDFLVEQQERIQKSQRKAEKKAAAKKAQEQLAQEAEKSFQESEARKTKEKADAEAKRKEEEQQERQRHLDNVKKMRDLYEAGSFETGDLLLEQIKKAEWPHHGLYEIANAVDEAVKFRHEKEREQIEEWERKAQEDRQKTALLEEARKHTAPVPAESETFEKMSLDEFQSDRLFAQRARGVEIPEAAYTPENLAQMENSLINAAFHIEDLVKEGKQEEAENELRKFVRMQIDASHLKTWDRLHRDLMEIVFAEKKTESAPDKPPEVESQKTPKNDEGEAEAEKPETLSQVGKDKGDAPDVIAEEKKEYPEDLVHAAASDADDYPDDEPEPAGPSTPPREPTPPPEPPKQPGASNEAHARLQRMLKKVNTYIEQGDYRRAQAGLDIIKVQHSEGFEDIYDAVVDATATLRNAQGTPPPEPAAPKRPQATPTQIAELYQTIADQDKAKYEQELEKLKAQYESSASQPLPPSAPAPATPKRPQATIEQITELYQTFLDKDTAKYMEEFEKLKKLKAQYKKDVETLVGADRERMATEKKLRAKIEKLELDLGAAMVNRQDPKVQAAYAKLQAENAKLKADAQRSTANMTEQQAKREAYRAEALRLRKQYLENQEWARQKMLEIEQLKRQQVDAMNQANQLEQLRNQQRQREAEQEHQQALREKQVREAEAIALAKKIDLEAKLEETKLADAQKEIEVLMRRLREVQGTSPLSSSSSSANALQKRLVGEIRKKQAHIDELKRQQQQTASLQADLARQVSVLGEQIRHEAPERVVNPLGVKRGTTERNLFTSPDSVPMLGIEGLFDEEDADAVAQAHLDTESERRRKKYSAPRPFAQILQEAQTREDQLRRLRETRQYRPIDSPLVSLPSAPPVQHAPRYNRDVLRAFQFDASSPLASSSSGINMGMPDAQMTTRPTASQTRAQMRNRHKKRD